MEQKIAWEKHPVSRERKTELRAQGFKIIDIRFAPDGGRGGVSGADDGRLPDAEQRKLLIDMLAERGIEFDEDMGTDELRALTITPNPDGLDDLDAEQLRALAAERGVAVHARAGADKIRAALRAAAE